MVGDSVEEKDESQGKVEMQVEVEEGMVEDEDSGELKVLLRQSGERPKVTVLWAPASTHRTLTEGEGDRVEEEVFLREVLEVRAREEVERYGPTCFNMAVPSLLQEKRTQFSII